MTKADKMAESLAILLEAGIKVPTLIHIQVEDQVKADYGTVQIWKCKKCHNWKYNSPVMALSVECPNGHLATIDWDITESILAIPAIAPKIQTQPSKHLEFRQSALE